MDRNHYHVTGWLAVCWVALLVILVATFTEFPRSFLPTIEILGFPFIFATLFLLARLTTEEHHDGYHAPDADTLAKLHDLPHVQYNDLETRRRKNARADYFLAKRKAAASHLQHP